MLVIILLYDMWERDHLVHSLSGCGPTRWCSLSRHATGVGLNGPIAQPWVHASYVLMMSLEKLASTAQSAASVQGSHIIVNREHLARIWHAVGHGS